MFVITEPVGPPVQAKGDGTAVAVKTNGSGTKALAVAVQLLKSVTVTVKVPGKTQVKTVTVTQRIEDSAKIKLLNSAIAARDATISDQGVTIKKQDKKISRKNKENWIWRIIASVLIIWQAYKIYRNLTTIKVR